MERVFGDPNEAFVGFKTTLPFDTVRLDLGSLASALEVINVYGSCVALQ